MITPAPFVDFGSASHFAAGDQHDIVLQPAAFQVLDKGGYGVVEGCTDSLHSVSHVQVVSIGMHVPYACVASVNGDETTAYLTEAPGQAEQGANRARLGRVITGPPTRHLSPIVGGDM